MTVEEQLDQIHSSVEEMMNKGRLRDLDWTLDAIRVEATPSNLLIGYLTATLPVKSALPARKQFYESVRKALMMRGEAGVGGGLLAGLK